jgi:hypothetical protein
MRRVRTGKTDSSTPQGPASSNNSAAIGGYDAYFGTYTVDLRARTVTHHLTAALGPADVGRSLTRQVTATNNELRLSFETAGSTGKPVTRTLIWRRAGSRQ